MPTAAFAGAVAAAAATTWSFSGASAAAGTADDSTVGNGARTARAAASAASFMDACRATTTLRAIAISASIEKDPSSSVPELITASSSEISLGVLADASGVGNSSERGA